MTFLVICIIGLVALAIFGFYSISGQAKEKEVIEDKLNNLPNFTPSKTILKKGIAGYRTSGISIDSLSNQICVIAGDSFKLFPFASLIAAEVVVDGQTVTKTSRGSQALGVAVGAVLGGGLGAVIGGLSGATTTGQKIKNVTLRLVLNDLDYPIHDVELIELTHTGSTVPKIALNEAEQWNNMLKVVMFQGQEGS